MKTKFGIKKPQALFYHVV